MGFMDALVRDDALMALEAAWYPTLSVARPMSLEMGLIASSQTSHFNDYFAFDLKPALQVHMGRERMVETAVYLGLAGEHREDLRVQVRHAVRLLRARRARRRPVRRQPLAEAAALRAASRTSSSLLCSSLSSLRSPRIRLT